MLVALRVALSFLTRLPVRTGEVSPEVLGRSVAYFPLVGALLGALALGAASGLTGHVPASITGFLLVALSAAISGGLHLDGLADLFDGLSGGRGDRERTLAIMRDSHVGAHGVAALALVLIGKVIANGELVAQARLAPLLAAPIVARLACVLLITRLPYARSEGLGRAMHDHARGPQLVAATVFALVALTPVVLARDLPLMAAGAAGLVLVQLAGSALSKRLGGLTGDVYGAAIELCELLVLLACTTA